MKSREFGFVRALSLHRYALSCLYAITLSSPMMRTPAVAQTNSRSVVISQVYGGGGNAGATLRNDFVELFNRGSLPVNINGWSIQYAATGGSTWMVTSLNGSIGPGQYYLVQEEQGSGGTIPLPAADALGSINLNAITAKVALVNNSTPLRGVAPTGPNVVGVVGYGATDFAEGAPVPSLSNTIAAVRRDGGCLDSSNNFNNFNAAAPNPRNTNSPRNSCAVSMLPTITSAGVTNAASFLSGPVSPGELVTIFGSNIGPSTLTGLELTSDGAHVASSLASTRVLFDGVAAPLIYVWGTQLTAAVPYTVAGKLTTNLQVEVQGQLSNRITLPVIQAAPGIFTATQSGQGQAAVLNQDLSINTPLNPAAAGTSISIYGTGMGQTNPPGEDGRIIGSALAFLNATVTVQIGGMNADVSYNGTAPGLISGVMQINVRLPDNLPTSDALPLVLRIGTIASQLTSTVAVHNPGTTPSCGTECGVERWSVKNLTDADATKVNFAPKTTTVNSLLSQPAPRQLSDNQRIAPVELQTFQVIARLVGFKLEDDMDFHVVIADPMDPSHTMIVEIPSTDCADACRSGHSPEFAAARNVLKQRFGAATLSFHQLPPVLISITGIGFFDYVHGQTGVASNGIELHPVLSIQFLE